MVGALLPPPWDGSPGQNYQTNQRLWSGMKQKTFPICRGTHTHSTAIVVVLGRSQYRLVHASTVSQSLSQLGRSKLKVCAFVKGLFACESERKFDEITWESDEVTLE